MALWIIFSDLAPASHALTMPGEDPAYRIDSRKQGVPEIAGNLPNRNKLQDQSAPPGDTILIGAQNPLQKTGAILATLPEHVPGEVVDISTRHSRIPTPRFKDIDRSFAKDDINDIVREKIITSYGDGTFRPNDPITRAESVRIIVKARDQMK